MNVLAIIPARGGSKGIPRKNIKPLAGKPLIAHTIDQALACESVTRLIVSTDDAEIAQISANYGAEVIHRPEEISGDFASSEDALLHTLSFLEEHEQYIPDIIVFLQCTAPLTSSEDITGTIELLLENPDYDSATAVVPFHYFLWKRDTMGNAIGVNHDKKSRLLRQQRSPEYLESGAIYVMRTAKFKESRNRFCGNTVLYEMPLMRRWEIDEPVDFLIAEALLLYHRQIDMVELMKSTSVLILDFDGVFTDNKVIVFDDGREAITAHRGDGWGIARLREVGMPILVLSTERNPVVAQRCKKLGIEYIQGVDNKLEKLKMIAADNGWERNTIAYIGNDVNDLSCMQWVGLPIAVADAVPEIKNTARWITTQAGGDGAIREVVEAILKARDTNNGKA